MRTRRRKPLHRKLHDYLFPHAGNGYTPLIWNASSVAAILVLLVLLEGAYLGGRFIFSKTSFFASVLPGALVALANQDRATNDVPPVTENAALDKAAAAKAKDMAAKGYFSHVSPDGTTPWQWLSGAGYDYSYAGENLAVNFSDSKDVETAWMNSPMHRANLLKPQYTEVGIGVADGTYQGKAATFVVQFFATPASPAPVTPPALAKQQKAAPAPRTPVAPAGSAIAVAAPPASTSAPAVLGTEVPVPPAPAAPPASAWSGFMDVALASPAHTVTYLVTALLALIGILLAVTFVVRLRVRHLGTIMAGLIILLAASTALFVNDSLGSSVVVPGASQGAAAIQAVR
ncbi:hypothetical protein KGQ55_01785 [Patescibacteria group bacterium]|nr:hypothetical protein [Patescibacteria group bacterium]